MADRHLTSMMGLCRKAGKLCTGAPLCEKTLKTKKARLIIVAADSSENTGSKFVNKAFFYEVPCLTMFTKEELGDAVGKGPTAVVAVTDENFAAKIMELVKGLGQTKKIDDANICTSELNGKQETQSMEVDTW